MGAMAGAVDQHLVEVIESAAEGDEIAFSRIVATYHEQLFGFCVVICRDRSLAEEAVQSTWSTAWRKLGTVREAGRLRPWFMSVAANESKQLLRSRRRRSRVEVYEDGADQGGGPDPATGVDGLDLRVAMRRLDADDRALLAMRYVFGFDATELSTATGISPAGTRQRLKRLLDRLRQALE